jgi:hypothetical protein
VTDDTIGLRFASGWEGNCVASRVVGQETAADLTQDMGPRLGDT